MPLVVHVWRKFICLGQIIITALLEEVYDGSVELLLIQVLNVYLIR